MRIRWTEGRTVEIVDDIGRVLARRRRPEGLDGVTRLHALIGEHTPVEWVDLEPGGAAAMVKVEMETDRGPWVAALAATGNESCSFGKPEKYEECAVEPDEICIGEAPEMVAHVRPRHRRDLVDHDLAWLLDPGGRCHLYIDPRQRCVEGIGCQGTDRDRRGCIEPILLNDDDRSRLAGVDTSCRSDAYVASPHSAVQSTEMASAKAWSSASCSLAAMAADWR